MELVATESNYLLYTIEYKTEVHDMKRFLVVIMALFLVFFSMPLLAEAGQSECIITQAPNLYEYWRENTARSELNKRDGIITDDEFRDSRVSRLDNVFIEIVKMTNEQRTAKGETVLWEDHEVMVLVDTFSKPVWCKN